MPDLDLIKQAEQGVRDRRGRFAKGRSGNPAGRPRGCRDHVNRAARLLASEGEALTRKAVELALAEPDHDCVARVRFYNPRQPFETSGQEKGEVACRSYSVRKASAMRSATIGQNCRLAWNSTP